LLVVVGELGPACPKCGTERGAGSACVRCGLLSSHMDAYRADREASVSPRLRETWQDALARWSDPASHDRVVAVAAELESFAWVATRYRELARTGDAIAAAQLARISRAAEVAMTIGAVARRTGTPEKTPYRGLKMMIAVLVMTMLGTWVYARFQPAGHESPPPITHLRGR
jgi:hypothetical protein